MRHTAILISDRDQKLSKKKKRALLRYHAPSAYKVHCNCRVLQQNVHTHVCDTVHSLQHTAMYYTILQRAATHCNMLHNTATYWITAEVLMRVQHAAAYCNMLQRTATYCNILRYYWSAEASSTHCNTLQHTATHCNMLQRTAIRCMILQQIARHTAMTYLAYWVTSATHCNTIAATLSNVLQHTSIRLNAVCQLQCVLSFAYWVCNTNEGAHVTQEARLRIVPIGLSCQ